MTSQVEICNLSLSHVGAYRIQSLTESTKEARQCNLLFSYARDSALSDHDWTFARKTISLALLPETYGNWAYAYQYPSDCITPRKLFNEAAAEGVSKLEYEIGTNADLSSKVIMTDKEDAMLVYTARVVDPTMFDTAFIEALAWKLAGDLAIPIKGKVQLKQLFTQQYVAVVERAKAINAQSEEKQPDNVNTFVNARN